MIELILRHLRFQNCPYPHSVIFLSPPITKSLKIIFSSKTPYKCFVIQDMFCSIVCGKEIIGRIFLWFTFFKDGITIIVVYYYISNTEDAPARTYY